MPILILDCNPVPAKHVSSETLPLNADVNSDLVITREVIKSAIGSTISNNIEAIGIRTPLNCDKKFKNWSFEEKPLPPYFTPEAAAFISKDLNIKHWLVDLPSVDRLSDQGQLLCHTAFFENRKFDRFITELCHFEDKAIVYNEQKYNLYIHYLPWYLCGDVIPTRPILLL